MTVHYNEFLEPSYELDELETQELHDTGFTYDEENQVCITMDSDKNIRCWTLTANYGHIKLNY